MTEHRKAKLWQNILEFWKKHKRKIILYGGGAVLAFMIIIPVITYLNFVKDLGSKESIVNHNNSGVILLDRDDKPFFTFYQATQKDYIPLSEISKYAQDAVIASEDKDFYKHPGFSISGMARSAVKNVQESSIQQGGSTITQQLVKNVLLSPDRTFLRKYQEIVLAAELERRYTKDEILEMYLNSVYFGEGALGIEDAAKAYFDKDAKNLNLAESAILAGILPAPSALSPISGNKTRALERQKVVLKLMKDQKKITEEQRKNAAAASLHFQEGASLGNELAPHFALMVKDQLIEEYGENAVARSGFKVKTTLNSDWQKYAEEAVANQAANLAANNANNAALVAINPQSGEIVALVGSKDWSNEKFGTVNMALVPRQPGSSFKPLVYATAIEEDVINAGTVLEDKEKDFGGGYKPQNYDRQFRGNVTARSALAMSLNIPAVEVLERLGVDTMVEKAPAFGITTINPDNDYGLSLVLGSAEVPLLEMTGAYAVFANEGNYIKPTSIIEIRNKNDKVIFEQETKTKRGLSAEVAYIISSMLSDQTARAPVFGNALSISRQAAVKTGTTNDYKDAWTIGYTPDIVVGVWVGNNDHKPMNSVAGSLGPAPIWRNTMQYFLTNTQVHWFEAPSGIVRKTICREKGLLLDDKLKDATTSAIVEFFIRDSEPTEVCFELSPTPSAEPTKTDDQKKKEDEDRKKKEDEDKKKNATATPAPTAVVTQPEPSNTPVVTIVVPSVVTPAAASPTPGGTSPSTAPAP